MRGRDVASNAILGFRGLDGDGNPNPEKIDHEKFDLFFHIFRHVCL